MKYPINKTINFTLIESYIVTGSSNGIGLKIQEQLKQQNEKVITFSRKQPADYIVDFQQQDTYKQIFYDQIKLLQQSYQKINIILCHGAGYYGSFILLNQQETQNYLELNFGSIINIIEICLQFDIKINIYYMNTILALIPGRFYSLYNFCKNQLVDIQNMIKDTNVQFINIYLQAISNTNFMNSDTMLLNNKQVKLFGINFNNKLISINCNRISNIIIKYVKTSKTQSYYPGFICKCCKLVNMIVPIKIVNQFWRICSYNKKQVEYELNNVQLQYQQQDKQQ